MSERRSNGGELIGPAGTSAWKKWREARDRKIANPRRLKTCRAKERRQ